MNASWIYLMLKAALCMGAFYLVYSLFLRRDTHFALNRYYLIITVLMSLLIPLVSLNISLLTVPESYGYILDTISVGSRMVEDAFPDDSKAFELLVVCYSAGMVVFLTGFLIRLARLMMIVRRYGWTEHKGMKLVFLPPGSGSPFSFFGYVFITREHYHSPSASEMLMHEKVHIRQLHSVDLLLLEILVLLQWFNPFIWLYRRSIRHIHEYIADEGVIRQSDDRKTYQYVLLHIGSGFSASTLTHNFNHSLLKRRFIMMNRSKSLSHTRWKILTIVPVMAFLFLVFSDVSGGYLDQALTWEQPGKVMTGPLADMAFPKESLPKPAGLQAPRTQNDSIYLKVDEPPAFKGGLTALTGYITQNIKYPEQARKQGIQGTVFITFIIDEKGRVTNGKVQKGIGSGCDEEALRVVMAMPDWDPGTNGGTPVKVRFTLPIKFSLSEKDLKDTEPDINKDTPKDTDPE